MKPRHTVRCGAIEPPEQGRAGSALLSVHYPRPHHEPVRVALLARTDHEGRRITIQSGAAEPWDAGLVWATFRWSPDDGPADLLLWWPGHPPDIHVAWREDSTDPPSDDVPDPPGIESLNAVGVSDAVLLARDNTAQWAVQALFDTLTTMGRPPGLTVIENNEQVYEAMQATKAKGRKLTMHNVAAIGGTFTYDNLRSYLHLTGRNWVRFRDDFLRTS